MSWSTKDNEIYMIQGDYGIGLPITVYDVFILENDYVKITIKKEDQVILEKIFTKVRENTIFLNLTEEESALLDVGLYSYSIDWYRDGAFIYNIIPASSFRVVART